MNIAALEIRARVLRQLRAFFDARGFVEVETPVRIAAPAPEPHIDCPAAIARPEAAALARPTFLRASPELQMKKLLAAGGEKADAPSAAAFDPARSALLLALQERS